MDFGIICGMSGYGLAQYREWTIKLSILIEDLTLFIISAV